MSDRLFRLMERHQKLDRMVDVARSHRFADPFQIARLKKMKLALKDRIARVLHDSGRASNRHPGVSR